jgi:hypothetical protein
MLCGAKVAVCSEINTKRINIMFLQNIKCFKIKPVRYRRLSAHIHTFFFIFLMSEYLFTNLPEAVYDSVEIPTRCNLVIQFIIPKFIEGSTCFEWDTAHHQEL